MKYLIVEDEYHAAKRLNSLITKQYPDAQCLKVIDSVQDAVEWFNTENNADLAFFDIQLADGLSFSIFQQATVETPVIFTTAFDEYALKAFKANSVDYLLKPVDEKELGNAIEKYKRIFGQKTSAIESDIINQLMQKLNSPDYIRRFLIKQGTALTYVAIEDIALFYSQDGLTFLQTKDGMKHNVDYTLEQVLDLIDPKDYFRINRSLIVQIDSIKKISSYFNSRLKLTLAPKFEDAIVSRDKVKKFKSWVTGASTAIL